MIFDLFNPVGIIHPEKRGEECWRVLFRLRSTCRKFRTLVNELPFWFDGNFRLVEMIPRPRTYDDGEKFEVAFLRLLFQDPYLVQCLERRTSWHFQNVGALRAVANCVPSFSSRGESLSFFGA